MSDHRTRPPTDAESAAVAALINVPPAADDLGRLFADAGFELYLVGGSVRDALLERGGQDLDFTTDARPEQIRAVLQPWSDALWDTGIDFGTLAARRGEVMVEITTYRADSYDGVSRNPQVTFGDSLVGDLRRRDFTINSMALSVPGHQFFDPYGGFAHLAQRILDTPGTPAESFGDDPLRMLRAVRFVGQLGVELAPRVRAALVEMAGQISRITAERVQAELTKLILADHVRLGLELLVDSHLADHVLPELPALQLERDEHHQHKDVYQHSLTVLEQAIALESRIFGSQPVPDPQVPDLTLRWAALLHDIGKPATRRFESGGAVSFHHHEVVGSKLVRKRLRALKYPKQLIEDVANLTFLHLRFHGFASGVWTDSAVRRYVTDAGDLLQRLHKLVQADCTTRNARRRAQLVDNYRALVDRIDQIAAAEDLARIRPDLDGNRIMDILGVGPGPLVGRAWAYLKELRLERGPLSAEAAEAELRAWAARQE